MLHLSKLRVILSLENNHSNVTLTCVYLFQRYKYIIVLYEKIIMRMGKLAFIF